MVSLARRGLSYLLTAALLSSLVLGVPSNAMAQTRVDSIGPAIAWQIHPRGEEGSINGIIFTSAGRPLYGARIRVSGLSGWAQTDSSGHFALRIPVGRKVDVQVQALGYHTARDSVFIPGGRSAFLIGVLRDAIIHITPVGPRIDTLTARQR